MTHLIVTKLLNFTPNTFPYYNITQLVATSKRSYTAAPDLILSVPALLYFPHQRHHTSLMCHIHVTCQKNVHKGNGPDTFPRHLLLLFWCFPSSGVTGMVSDFYLPLCHFFYMSLPPGFLSLSWYCASTILPVPHLLLPFC